MSPVPLAVSFIPVLVFLLVLFFMDSYQLLSPRDVLRAIGAGAAAAILSLFVHQWAAGTFEIPTHIITRYIAPLTEEVLKGLFIVLWLRLGRVGFLVDAAIYGFAVGAGFSLIENLYYLRALPDADIWLWIIRGFGTAILHGSTTSIFAMISKRLSERHENTSFIDFLPGLGSVALVHSLFNHFILPLAMTGILLAVLPVLVVFVFERSEKATERWLGAGFDSETELLELILSGELTDSRVGRYLDSLQRRFPGNVVADMLCYLQIHLELSLRAKGMLMAQEAGLKIEPGPQVKANLVELQYLEKTIGKTGKLAILPFLHRSRQDLWQLYMLQK